MTTDVQGEDIQEIRDDLLPHLVFRESEYYDSIANPASFVNHTPQSFFQRLNVLFIGTSLDDLNIRRWLRSSFRERVERRTHYLRELYSNKYDGAECEAKLESVRNFWLKSVTETISGKDVSVSFEARRLIELVMRELGVQVVWCDDSGDMRRCIRELKEMGRESGFGRRTVFLSRAEHHC
jgi:hypothetical protein